MGELMLIFQLNNSPVPVTTERNIRDDFQKVVNKLANNENALNNLIRPSPSFQLAEHMNYLAVRARTPLFMLEIDALG